MIIILSGILVVVNVSIRKKAAHLLTEECEEIIDNKIVPIKKHNKTLLVKKYNKTVSIKENISLDSCKPFVASFILFLLVSVIITVAFVYFYVTLQPKKITRLLLKNYMNHQIYKALISCA